MAGKKSFSEGKVNKMALIRQTLAELGRDAKPLKIQAYVREKHGIEMSADHISTYKGVILRKMKRKARSAAPATATTEPLTMPTTKKRRRRKGRRRAQLAPVAPAAAAHANGKSPGITLGDLETAKSLIGRVGPEGLRKLIDLLSR